MYGNEVINVDQQPNVPLEAFERLKIIATQPIVY